MFLLRIVAARSAGLSQETFCTSPSNLYSGLMSLTEVVHWRFRCRVWVPRLLVSSTTYLSVVAKRTVRV